MTDGPLLWYLNRGTGIVILVLLTLSLVLGVRAATARPGRVLPRFVVQHLHRNLALVAMTALVAHIATAVVDTYVDIRWWQAVVPVGATYEPLWLGLGAVAVDVLLVVVATSLLRTRLRPRQWRAVHLASWAAWGLSVGHSLGIGTDLRDPAPWSVAVTGLCVTAVLVAGTARVARLLGTSGRDAHERVGVSW